MITKAMLPDLLEQGLAYRYKRERWERLQRASATLLPSPNRQIWAGGEDCVEELIQPLLVPQLLTLAEVNQLNRLAAAWEAFTMVQLDMVRVGLSEHHNDPTIRSLAGQIVSADQRRIALHDPGYSLPAPFLRLDLVRTAEGFKAIDINLTRPSGLGDCMTLDPFYERTSTDRRFSTSSVFSGTVRRCFNQWQDYQNETGQARIAILLEETAGDWHNFQALAAALRQEDWVNCVDVLPSVEAITAGGYNCVIRGRVKFGHPMFEKLLALPTDRFCVISPLGGRYLGNKYWFVALRDPTLRPLYIERLGADRYALLDAAIPETGVLTGDMVSFSDRVISVDSLTRKDWVLKPPAGSSAQGIYIGKYTNRGKWDDAYRSAGKGALLQRYFQPKERVAVLGADGEPTIGEYHMKYGAFFYGGKVAGVEVMARPTSLVHGARDTYFSICA